MNLLIYQDYVHNNGLLHKRLSALYGADNVGFCDAADILDGCLKPDAVDLLVMPGGADLYYCEKLNGAGTTAIRRYVEAGGRYLGICAGAYFACQNIEWAEGIDDHEICGPRELAFSQTTAIGPVYDLIEDGDINKSWNGVAHLMTRDGHHSPVLYTGGPVFQNAPDDEVFARYTNLPDEPAAILKCRVGDGNVVLCSPHIESLPSEQVKALYKNVNPSHSWDQTVIGKLTPYEDSIRTLQRIIFDTALGRINSSNSSLRKSA